MVAHVPETGGCGLQDSENTKSTLTVGSSAWACREGIVNHKGVAVAAWVSGTYLFFKHDESKWYISGRDGVVLSHSGPQDWLLRHSSDYWEIREIPKMVIRSIRDKPVDTLTFWEQAVLTLHAARFVNCDAPDILHTINHVDNLIAGIDRHLQELDKK